jgi:hypothetical protein
MSSFEKCLFGSVVHFLIWLFMSFFFLLLVFGVSHVLWILTPCTRARTFVSTKNHVGDFHEDMVLKIILAFGHQGTHKRYLIAALLVPSQIEITLISVNSGMATLCYV